MQFTAHGPVVTVTGSVGGCHSGSNPPIWIRPAGFAHGPFDQSAHGLVGGEYSRPRMNRRFRPAHSASRNVFDVPSFTSTSVRRQCCWTVPDTRVRPSTPMNIGS